jgi:hypothetical protein
MNIQANTFTYKLPEKDIDCFTQCYKIFNNTEVILHPNKIVIVDTGLIINPQKFEVIHIKNHLCNKPWRIMGEFFSASFYQTLQVPVITSKACTIKAGEVLCHMLPTTITAALTNIKGKIKKIYKIIHINLLIFYTLCCFRK